MLENNINFSSPLKGFIPEPKPGVKFIPDQYKKMEKLFENKNPHLPSVKACIPFLDAMTSGYIIPFPMDIQFHYDPKKNESKFLYPQQVPERFLKNHLGVNSHMSNQVPPEMKPTYRGVDEIFKFLNPWVITTPPGTSCLFMTPPNRSNAFELVAGLVDTDTYPLEIHFPFYWLRPQTENYLLKQGDPMVAVFPFKRQQWKMTASYQKPEFETLLLTKIVDNYKRIFWQKKSYK